MAEYLDDREFYEEENLDGYDDDPDIEGYEEEEAIDEVF